MVSSCIKPVLLIDEAQEMAPDVLSELRILSSADFDATSLLTVVLAGDERLVELLRHPDLVPLGTRIRTRLKTEAASREELSQLLSHALSKAGNATLLTAELRDTLVDHCAGNYRLLMTMGGELLAYGMAHEVQQLDEKFYLEVIAELHDERRRSLQEQVLERLAAGVVLTRAKLRDTLGVKNERLGEALESLERAGQLRHTPAGWQRLD